jgi:hypothetical protein
VPTRWHEKLREEFTGIVRSEEFRTVTRAHVIAWRDDLARRVQRSPQGW